MAITHSRLENTGGGHMRIEQLQYLVEVAETGSINLAAEKFYISQQGLGDAIKKLEKEFGVDLLQRSYKGVYLTETGKIFVEKAKVLLSHIEEFKKEFQSNNAIGVSPLKGSLKIAVSASPLLDNNLLQNTLALFNKEHPRVNIIIAESDLNNVISYVADNRANIGILVTLEKFLTGDAQCPIDYCADVIFEKLHSDKLVMCAGKMSPLANRKSISLKEAIKHPVIVYQPDEASDNSWYINRLKALGNIDQFIVTSSSEIYRQTIIRGRAIGYTAFSYLEANPFFKNEITVLSIIGYSKLTCGWILPKNREPSEAAKEFMKMWYRNERHKTNTVYNKGTIKTSSSR
jgi:DNA-binding transcriptional LysR family regulator